jgi:putative PEP-CTERM system histidine kinase
MYRSMTLLAVGLYLVILGLIGEGMEHFEVPFHRALVMIIFFAAGMGLIAMMLSNRLRRRTKVLVSKHFMAPKHDYRSEWISFTNKLAACRTLADLEQAILAVYGETFGFAGTALYLRDRAQGTYRLAQKTRFSKGQPEFAPGPSLRGYFLARDRVLNPLDAEHSLTQEERVFVARSEATFIVPMVYGDQLDGLIVLGGQLAPGELIYEDYDLMKIMARQAAISLVSARLSEEIAESREIAAVARVSSFVIHDLKNLASSLSLMLENTADNISDPDFQRDMIDTVRNSLTKMQGLIQRLRTTPEKNELNVQKVELDELCRDTLADISGKKGRAVVNYTGSPVSLTADGEELRKVVMNLLLNAFEAVPAEGRVSLECGMNGGSAFIRVSDNGHGMTEEYLRDHLWRPFRTTKEKGLGIGLYQCRQIVEAHGGVISAESGYGRGSVFTVTLPLEARKQAGTEAE